MSDTRRCQWCREIVDDELCGCARENVERELEATKLELAIVQDLNRGLHASIRAREEGLADANKRADLARADRDRVFAEFDLLRERHRKVMDAIKEAMNNG